MCQEQYNTNKRKFKQLTYKERIKIETLYNDQHLNYTQIGDILGKHRTTISREIKLGLIELETTYLPIWKYWIVNTFLDNFYKDTFLYSIGVK